MVGAVHKRLNRPMLGLMIVALVFFLWLLFFSPLACCPGAVSSCRQTPYPWFILLRVDPREGDGCPLDMGMARVQSCRLNLSLLRWHPNPPKWLALLERESPSPSSRTPFCFSHFRRPPFLGCCCCRWSSW